MMRPNGVEKQVRPKWEWKPGANTVMYLNFGTNAGDLVDRSPNASNVVASRRNNSYTCFEEGINGYHLSFPKDYNYMVDVADNSTIRGADNWYIGCWFNIDSSASGVNIMLSKGYDSLGTGIVMGYNGSVLYGMWRDNTNPYPDASFSFTADSQWHHMAWSIQGKVWRMYLDKVLMSEADWSSHNMNYNGNTEPRHIGGQIYSSFTKWYYPLKGKIDEVIMEKQPRSVQDISKYVDATKGNYGL